MKHKAVSIALACAMALVAYLILDRTLLAASPCEDGCYSAKSAAYERCRRISPADRAARVRCFEKADRELQRCLSGCQRR